MRTYKPDVDSLRSELYNYHQPVVVAFNIENIVLVANIVNTIKGTFYICETCPVCFGLQEPLLLGDSLYNTQLMYFWK